MKNASLYVHRHGINRLESIVRREWPAAEIEVTRNGTRATLEATEKGGWFGRTKTLTLNYRERTTPGYRLTDNNDELTQQLSGMGGFVLNIPAQDAEIRQRLLTKIAATNAEIGFIGTPDGFPKFELLLRKAAEELNGFIFCTPGPLFTGSTHQYFADEDLRVILDTAGFSQLEELPVSIDAEYHDEAPDSATEDQTARKARSEAVLRERGVRVNENLPVLPSNPRLREVSAVTERIHALLVIAVTGEGGVPKAKMSEIIEGKKIRGFSPRESELLAKETLDDQDRPYATWRYESLYTLLWAAGFMETLPYPDNICDVPATVGAVMQTPRAEFEERAALRPAGELLDALDLTYRMHWACVNARLGGSEVGGGLNPSVIYERHYALNWLTGHDGADWDDVTTST